MTIDASIQRCTACLQVSITEIQNMPLNYQAPLHANVSRVFYTEMNILVNLLNEMNAVRANPNMMVMFENGRINMVNAQINLIEHNQRQRATLRPRIHLQQRFSAPAA